MRKDLRYGLGMGALLLAFIVTFLVVRNYTENQNAPPDGGTTPDGSGQLAERPEANPATPLAATDGATASNRSATLPPLPPAPKDGRPPVVPAPSTRNDPFVRRMETGGRTESGGGEMSASPKSNTTQDWDRLLEQGRLDPAGRQQQSPQTPRTNTGGTTTPPSGRSIRTVSTGGSSSSSTPALRSPGIRTRTGRPYTIKEGDSFMSIARAAYGSGRYFRQIEAANPNTNPNRLRIGDQIILPELSAEDRATRETGPITGNDNRPIHPGSEYRVDTGDSLYRIAMKLYGTPNMVDALYEANKSAIGPNPERLRFGMILKLPRPPADNK